MKININIFLLFFIIQNLFYLNLKKRYRNLQEVCQSAIIRKCSNYVKNAAIDCFENLLKICPGNKFDLKTTVTTLIAKFHLCNNSGEMKQ